MPPDSDDRETREEALPTQEIEESDSPRFVGETLAGRYRVESRLGAGAMGAVYLAEHVRIGRKDAIKLLNPDLADDDDAWARFTREARNASHINHPNVCTVYDFGETDEGLPYIAMEYVEGETLTDLLEHEGRLEPARVGDLAEEITRALEAAHNRGIVHRDLKPDNIMLDRDEYGSSTVKVVDFGIAKAVQDEEGGQDVTREGMVVGTPQYVSPEQVAGEELDPRSDLYSLGVVLYEMLSGRLPFTGDTWRKVMTKRLSQEPIPLGEAASAPGVGPELERVIHRALRRDPEDRYESAEAMRVDLLDAVEKETSRREAVPSTRTVGSGEEAGPRAWLAGALDELDASWRAVLYATALVVGLGGVAFAGVSALGGGGSSPSPADGGGSTDLALADSAGQGADSLGRAAAGVSGAGAGASDNGGAGDGGTREAGGDTEPAGAGTAGGGDETAAADERDGGAAAEPEPSDVSGGEAPDAGDAATGAVDDSSPLAGLSPAGVDSLLFRQQAVFSPLNDPAPAAVRAAGDTARLVWKSADRDGNRAFAAYIYGQFLLEEGDTIRARDWLQRAVDLDPESEGYRSLLESLPNQP